MNVIVNGYRYRVDPGKCPGCGNADVKKIQPQVMLSTIGGLRCSECDLLYTVTFSSIESVGEERELGDLDEEDDEKRDASQDRTLG